MSQLERTRRYKAKMYKYWRSYNLCGRCGLPTELNGRIYSECRKHRIQSAIRSRRLMAKRRSQIK